MGRRSWLDSMIFKVFSNLSDSTFLGFYVKHSGILLEMGCRRWISIDKNSQGKPWPISWNVWELTRMDRSRFIKTCIQQLWGLTWKTLNISWKKTKTAPGFVSEQEVWKEGMVTSLTEWKRASGGVRPNRHTHQRFCFQGSWGGRPQKDPRLFVWSCDATEKLRTFALQGIYVDFNVLYRLTYSRE